MLLPVKLGLYPSVVIPPPTEIKHKSIEPTIAPTAQLAPEDHSQLKHPPELGMLVPVEPGLDPSVVILPSTETEHKSTEPTLAPAAQLASAIFSKDPVAKKVVKANISLFNLQNQIKCHLLACLIQNLQTIRPKTILLLKIQMRLALA